MGKYKRGDLYYICKESKYRQEVVVKNLIKWAQAGDWICQLANEKGEPVGPKFIAQPKEFYETFEKA